MACFVGHLQLNAVFRFFTLKGMHGEFLQHILQVHRKQPVKRIHILPVLSSRGHLKG